MTIFDDLEAEQDRLEAVLAGLDEPDWVSPSAAAGWTVADVVLHLAQTEEAVVATVRAGGAAPAAGTWLAAEGGPTTDEAVERSVRAERGAPEAVFERWRNARRTALASLRAADPARPVIWVAAPLRPPTLATTRLAEHWAHGLDVTEPLGLPWPDTDRLRHVAWLGHRTLPYGFAVAGEEPGEVSCELTAPDGSVWTYGRPDAPSRITGPAGAFCRVGAHRLAPADSGLVATGPRGEAALRVLRNYAA